MGEHHLRSNVSGHLDRDSLLFFMWAAPGPHSSLPHPAACAAHPGFASQGMQGTRHETGKRATLRCSTSVSVKASASERFSEHVPPDIRPLPQSMFWISSLSTPHTSQSPTYTELLINLKAYDFAATLWNFVLAATGHLQPASS